MVENGLRAKMQAGAWTMYQDVVIVRANDVVISISAPTARGAFETHVTRWKVVTSFVIGFDL